MFRALVTGAHGFIGRQVCAALRAEGAELTTVGRYVADEPRHFAFGPAPWSTSQWAEALLAAEPDIIFHLAGAQRGDDGDLVQANVGLACGLLAALNELNVRPNLVFAGSAAEYGSGVIDGVPIAEETACAPRGTYGQTKLAQSLSALAFAKQTGARVLVARIFNPIGPGMPPHLVLGDFAQQIVTMGSGRGCLVTGDIDVARDFLDVTQVAAILVALARNPAASGIVNVCSGVPTVIRRLVEHMITVSGKPIDIRVDHTRLRPGEPRVLFGSTAKLASFLPVPADLRVLVDAILVEAGAHRPTESRSRLRLMPS